MPINGYFDTVFASSGSVTPIPDAVQPDGSVSYEQGYGVNYTLNPAVNPSALNIEQTKFNQLIYDITSAIQYFQQGNAAAFITSTMNNGSPYTYPQYATVSYLGVTYISLVAGNADTPPSAKWAIINSNTSREILSGARTYYVRTDGSNTNTGLVNNAGGAFLTIQHAIDVLQNTIDLGGQTVTIQVADGTYTTPVVIAAPFTGGGLVQLQGNLGTPANVLLHTTSATVIQVQNGAMLYIAGGIKLQATTGGNGLYAAFGGLVQINGAVDFGACATSHILITGNSEISINANYSVSGNAPFHWDCETGKLDFVSSTLTLTGTPAFSSAFAQVSLCGSIQCNGNTFTGSATGVRYLSDTNGVINTGGGGASYLPGNSSGSTATGGQYV